MVKQRHQCPSCGAALGIPEEHDPFFRCGFCGTVIEDRARTQPPPPGAPPKVKVELRVGSSPSPEQLAQYRGAARTASLVVVLVALVLVGAGAFAVYTLVGEATDAVPGIDVVQGGAGVSAGSGDQPLLGISGVTTAEVVVADDDSSPDVVLVGRGSESSLTAYLDVDADTPVRWSDATQLAVSVHSPLVPAGDLVVLSAEDGLIARNRQSGAVAWESMLTDVIQHNICPGCVQVFGDALVTLTADGVLRATDLASGSTRWEVRLTETPRQVVDLGGQPTVLDNVDGEVQLVRFDVATGDVAAVVAVGCPDTTFGGVDAPSIYAPMVPAGDGSAAWVVGGTTDPCVQRVDAGAMEPAVTTPLERLPGVPSWDHDNVLLADGRLFLVAGHRALAVDAETGALTDLLDEPDLDLLPVDAADGVLVVSAENRRGTSSFELRAVDVELGSTIWRFDVEAAEPYDATGRPVDEEGHWDAAVTSGGVTVLQVFETEAADPLAQPARVVLQSIPLRSGTTTTPVTREVTGSVSAWTHPVAWRGDRLWLLTDTLLTVFDAVTGEPIEVARL